MTPEEKAVVQHFHDSHTYLYLMRMLPVVPLPQLPNHVPLGESRSRAVQRFNTIEHSLHSNGEWSPFPDAIKEYIDLEHTEIVPEIDLSNTIQPTTYHGVYKPTSTVTKLHASAKTQTDVSLSWWDQPCTLSLSTYSCDSHSNRSP